MTHPTVKRLKKNMHYLTLDTPVGPLMAAATHKGLAMLEFGDPKRLQPQLIRLRKLFKDDPVEGENSIIGQTRTELREYFARSRREFSIPLLIRGTPFQESVWHHLLTIPYGETRSYLDQARALGNPNSVRAVAQANGNNRLAIVIPCHRVIGSNGRLTGYGGGLSSKRFLIDLEQGRG